MSIFISPVNANEEQMRIEAHQVNIDNYEKFVEQNKCELPVGTSIQNVKACLSENQIEYGYVPQADYIQFMLKKTYSAFFVVKTDLHVEIFLSGKSGVSEIKYDLIETAF